MKYIDEYLVTGDFTLYLNVNQCKWVSIPKGNYFCFLMVVLNKEGQSSTESYIKNPFNIYDEFILRKQFYFRRNTISDVQGSSKEII